jgi:hypothetical protein
LMPYDSRHGKRRSVYCDGSGMKPLSCYALETSCLHDIATPKYAEINTIEAVESPNQHQYPLID